MKLGRVISMNGASILFSCLGTSIVFAQSTEPAAGDKLDPNTGGTATLDMNAGATVYGAVVVQGQINKANGTAAIVFNADVFKNFSNSIPASTSNLPGAWTDRLSY